LTQSRRTVSWGPHRPGASEHLAPNALRHWAVEPGCYDLKASNGSKSASWFDREVMSSDTVRLAVPAELSAAVAPSDPARAIAELEGR
jgi:hypothetical protein